MGIFVNENTLNGYGYNNGYHTDLYSPSDYTIYDEGVDINYTTLGYEIVAESQEEWNTLMKQVALNELAVYSSNGCREVLYEATSFSAVFNKIKEFFKKLAEKVKAIFHSFMAKMSSVFGKSSSFAKKYGQDFINKVQNIRDDFEFKGYTFTIKNFKDREGTMFDEKIASIYTSKANYTEGNGSKKIGSSIVDLLKTKGSDIDNNSLNPTKFVTESVLYEVTKNDFILNNDILVINKLRSNNRFNDILNSYNDNEELSTQSEKELESIINGYLSQQQNAAPTSGNSGQQAANPIAGPDQQAGSTGGGATTDAYKQRLDHIKGATQLINDNAEEIADAIRAEVAKLYVDTASRTSDSYSEKDFKNELFKLFRNGEEKKNTIQASEIKKMASEIVTEVSNFKKTKDYAKESTKLVINSIDTVYTKLDKISKAATASNWGITETGTNVTSMCSAFGTLLSTIADKFFRTSREALTAANGVYLTALKDRCVQYKNIMVKVIAGSNSKKMANNESYDYGYGNDYNYGSSNGFLDNVIFK